MWSLFEGDWDSDRKRERETASESKSESESDREQQQHQNCGSEQIWCVARERTACSFFLLRKTVDFTNNNGDLPKNAEE